MAILNLPPVKWEFTRQVNFESNGADLGDGYSLTGTVPFSDRDTYTLTFPGLSDFSFWELWDLIKFYEGHKSFEWREFEWQEYKTFVFDGEPQAKPMGQNVWELSVTLKEIK